MANGLRRDVLRRGFGRAVTRSRNINRQNQIGHSRKHRKVHSWQPPTSSPDFRVPDQPYWQHYCARARVSRPGAGPLAGLFGALVGQMSARNEFSVFIDDAKRQRILHGLFDHFYADSCSEVIFDTNRSWCAWMPAIARLFPKAKVIACVRNVSWVVDSLEQLVQRNVFSPSSIFNYSAGGTVYTRANGLVATDGLVGAPYDALKQAC